MVYNIPSMDKFDLALNDASNKFVMPIFEHRKKEVTEVYMNILLDLDGSKSLANASTPEGRFVAEISMGAFGVFDFYDALCEAVIYLRRFPFRGTRVSKSRYLAYTLQNYLNNVYILQLRIKAYLNLLQDYYAKGDLQKDVKRIIQPLFHFNSQMFKEIVDIRGTHVHVETLNDDQVKRLGWLESQMERADTKSESYAYWESYVDGQYQLIRREKIEFVKSINGIAKIALEHIFSRIYTVVFDEGNQLRFPLDYENTTVAIRSKRLAGELKKAEKR